MKSLSWVPLLLLGGCVVAPPPYGTPGAVYPGASYGAYPTPDNGGPIPLTPPGVAVVAPPAPLPPPVQAAPLSPPSPFTDEPATADGVPPPATDTPPDASAAGPGDSLADTIARLRGDQGAPPADASAQTDDPIQVPAPPPQAVPVSAPPPIGQVPAAADATAAPRLDMTRPGYHDHYGGLNSDGDVAPH